MSLRAAEVSSASLTSSASIRDGGGGGGKKKPSLLDTLKTTDDIALMRKIALNLYTIAVDSEAKCGALQQQLDALTKRDPPSEPPLNLAPNRSSSLPSLAAAPVPSSITRPLRRDHKSRADESIPPSTLKGGNKSSVSASASRDDALTTAAESESGEVFGAPADSMEFCKDLQDILDVVEREEEAHRTTTATTAAAASAPSSSGKLLDGVGGDGERHPVVVRKKSVTSNRHALRLPRAMLQNASLFDHSVSTVGGGGSALFDPKEKRESAIHLALGKKRNVFGASLAEFEYAGREHRLPLVMETLLIAIELRGGFEAEGLFRRSASALDVKRFEAHLNRGEYAIVGEMEDAHTPASLLLRWLSSLKQPVVPWELYSEFINVKNRAGRIAIIRRMPNVNRDVLMGFGAFLGRLVHPSVVSATKMDAGNLAMTISPSLFRPPSESSAMELMSNNVLERNVLKDFILDCSSGSSIHSKNLSPRRARVT